MVSLTSAPRIRRRQTTHGLAVLFTAVMVTTGCNPAWQEKMNLPSQQVSNCSVTVPAAQTQTGWVQERITTNQANISVYASVHWVWNNGGGRYQLNPTLWSSGPTGWQSVTGIYPGESYRMVANAAWNAPASTANVQTRVVNGDSVLISTNSNCELTY